MLGVLGGMGPLATSHFYRLLVERTTADSDQQHLPVVIWADPTVPDRTAALVAGGPSPMCQMLNGIRWLQRANAACVAIPCNTAHAFRPKLADATGVEILDMIALALRAAIGGVPEATRVGILATRGTRSARVYEQAAEPLGLQIVNVSAHAQLSHLDPAIQAVKRGADWSAARHHVGAAARSLKHRGAEVIISACTEIPLVADEAAQLLPVIDSTQSLVDGALERMRPVVSHRP